MEQLMSEKGHMYGKMLFESLKNGQFKKEHRSNHFEDFTEGLESLRLYNFRSYISSCSAILMDERQKKSTERGYHG